MSSVASPTRKFALQPERRSVANLTFDGHSFLAEIAEITPGIAAEWLSESTTRNRPLNNRAVKRYATLMQQGRWILNGEAIVRDEFGNINNGHHRLNACIMAQTPFLSFVIHGVTSRAFTSYDKGKIRTMADILALDGRLNGRSLSSVIAHLWRHKQGIPLQTSTFPEPDVAIAIARENPGLAESVTSSYGFVDLTRNSVVAFCHYVFTPQDPDRAAQFFDGLRTGLNLKETSPIWHLRKRLLADRTSKAKLPAHHIIALFFKAWVAYRDGVPMKYLRWRTEGPTAEGFPSID